MCSSDLLQYGDCTGEIGQFFEKHGRRIHHWFEVNESLDQAAALIKTLDVIITVDNTVAHLSGALGVPTWVMLPANAEWRYGVEGDRMPWYPAMRLFRRRPGEDWHSVISQVRSALLGFTK